MAVIKCTGCSKDIPDQVSTCPNCGYPMHINRSRMSGIPPFSLPLPPERSDLKEIRTFSSRRIIRDVAISVGVTGLLAIIFLYSFQVPAATAFMQKVLDSYSSSGLVQTIINIPTFIAGGVPQSQKNGIGINQPAAPPGGTTAVNAGHTETVNSQQKTPIAPQVTTQKPPTPSSPYFVPNPAETCSQQVADWINKVTNGNPAGSWSESSVDGKVVFRGTVKENLYKTFSGLGKPCLFAEYETWTQSTGEIWQQRISINDITNPNVFLWVRDVPPTTSQSAMLQQLDAQIAALTQSGGASSQSVSQQSVPTINITEQSLVALMCFYSDGSMSRGSGVIVSPQGYILTAKHIVDPSWTSWAYGTAPRNAALNYCEVGIPPPNTLPTVEEIKTVNPSILVPASLFPLDATLYFEPTQGQLSDNEFRQLDFAVLKISKPSENCASYNLCTLPSSYPYNPVYFAAEPDTASYNQIINFGYPGEAITTSTSQNFTTFNLKGAVGRLTQYYGGDQYFKNQPFNFGWSAIDVIPGRSGSPIFWHGYVVGIEYAGSSQNITNDIAIGLPAIYQILKSNGMESILGTHY